MALAHTLGELKQQGYKPKSIKQEMRDNLIIKLQQKRTRFHRNIWL